MRKVFIVVYLIVLHISVVVPEGDSLNVHEETQENRMRNIGCELTYDVHAVFQTNALVFYSQLLIHNSLEDVKKLVSNIGGFTSQCCMPQAQMGCFRNKRIIFNDRVCEDHLSLVKNKDIALCCIKKDSDRNVCFQGVQNGPSANISEIYKSIPYWQLCLQYIVDKSTFMERQIYYFSRQYRIFPPRIIAKIITESAKLYSNCCRDSAFFNCFTEMELQILKTIRTLIDEGNIICQEYKKTGEVRTILWGIQYFTSLLPSGSMIQAVEFANSYEQLSSNCCDISTWTSNCFLDESEVILHHFLTKSNSASHLACYAETGQKRAECLSDIATEEAQGIPERIHVTPEQLCDIHGANEGSLIVWYTYEYTKRHRSDNLDVVLSSISELESTVKQCCQESNVTTCLSENFMKFGFSFST